MRCRINSLIPLSVTIVQNYQFWCKFRPFELPLNARAWRSCEAGRWAFAQACLFDLMTLEEDTDMKLRISAAQSLPAIVIPLLLSACAPAMHQAIGLTSTNPKNTSRDYSDMTCVELREAYDEEFSRTLVNAGPQGGSEGQLRANTPLEQLRLKGCGQ